MVQINGGHFTQGYTENVKSIGFDNEKPSFNKIIHKFWASKYKISFYEFMNFIKVQMDCGGKKTRITISRFIGIKQPKIVLLLIILTN